MTKVIDIYNFIDKIAPFRIQDSFDNAGLLVGSGDSEVKKVLISLDATVRVVNEAKELGCELVVTHHPVIFDPLKSLSDDIPAVRLLKNGISCISAHTNLDSAEYSVSDMMCDRLGLENTHTLVEVNRCDPKTGLPVGYGAVGESNEEMTPRELARLCRERFGSVAIKYVAGNRMIKKVGMISGAGGDGVFAAAGMGLDAYITSEVKHHQFLEAERLGLTLIDAGHHETEVIALPYLKEKLSEAFPDIEFIISKTPFAGMTVV